MDRAMVNRTPHSRSSCLQSASKTVPQQTSPVPSAVMQPHTRISPNVSATSLPNSRAPFNRIQLEAARTMQTSGIFDPEQWVAMMRNPVTLQAALSYKNVQLQRPMEQADGGRSNEQSANVAAITSQSLTATMALKRPSSTPPLGASQLRRIKPRLSYGTTISLEVPTCQPRKITVGYKSPPKAKRQTGRSGGATARARRTIGGSSHFDDLEYIPPARKTSSLPQEGARSTRPRRRSHLSEVTSLEDSTTNEYDDNDDDVPSSQKSLRSANRSYLTPGQLGGLRCTTPSRDISYPSIETASTESPGASGTERRHTVYELEHDGMPNSEPRIIRPSSSGSYTPIPQTRTQSQNWHSSSPGSLKYDVPAQLQGTCKAMGKTDWRNYVNLIERFVDGQIGQKELDREEGALFSVEDKRLRIKIRKLVSAMVAEVKLQGKSVRL